MTTTILVVDDHPLIRNAMRMALETVSDDISIDFAGSLEDALRRSAGPQAHDLVLLDLNLPDATGTATIGAFCSRMPGARVVAISGDEDTQTIRACRSAGAIGFLPKTYDLSRTVRTVRRALAGEPAFPAETAGLAPAAAEGRPGGWDLSNGGATGRAPVKAPSVPPAAPAGALPATSHDSPGTAGGFPGHGGFGGHGGPAGGGFGAVRGFASAPGHAPRFNDGRHLGLTERQREVLRLMLHGHPNKVICRELALAEGTVKVHVSAVLRALGVANRAQVVVAAHRAGIRFDEPGR